MIEGILKLAYGALLLLGAISDQPAPAAPITPPPIMSPQPGPGACEGGEYPNAAGRCPEDVKQ